jgi:hypothetical protein
MCCSGTWTWQCPLGCWQCRQALAQAVTSVESPFCTYLEAMRRRVTCRGRARNGETVFVQIQSPRAGENWGDATCVGVMDDSVNRFGSGGTGPQQRQKFLEQLLYLGWESDDVGGGRRAQCCYKRRSTCLGGSAVRGRMQNLLF